MAFDMGLDFRNTAGFVTDPLSGVFVSASDAFPTTYTNGNGFSINAGYTNPTSEMTGNDESTSRDVRLAGCHTHTGGAGGSSAIFKIDLSSGSVPGAGSYTVDMAANSQAGVGFYDVLNVKDNTTIVLGDYVGGVVSGKYRDATGVDDTPGSSSWDLVRHTASVAFATTTVVVTHGVRGDTTALAHFRLTQAATATFAPRMLMLLGVGT